jgi:hypothetical protein
MFRKPQDFILPLLLLFLASPAAAQKICFTSEARALAERGAKVWQEPDPGYDPVLGFNPEKGPRAGAPEGSPDGLTKPLQCVANKDRSPGEGTTPKFHCSVTGVVDEDGDLIRYKVKPHFKGQSKEEAQRRGLRRVPLLALLEGARLLRRRQLGRRRHLPRLREEPDERLPGGALHALPAGRRRRTPPRQGH